MLRIGRFAIGRAENLQKYQDQQIRLEALLKQVEYRIKELSGAQTTIVNEMFENVKADVKTLMHVYEKERSIKELLGACQGLDARLAEVERKLKGIA